ncbi:plasmid partitioning protein RepB C-terminal domain-containing protein [Achromobacter insuavis]
MFIALDGRMRVEALRDLGKEHALCLISTDDEGYTYNKWVNRLSVVQAHRMIVRAAERGVSIEQLANALDVSPGAIRARFRLLDGICSEAVAILADKPATYGMFRILRQMKPFRQIDVAQAMANLGNYSIKLATAMLQNTPTDQLVEIAAGKARSSTLRYASTPGARACRHAG